MKNFTNKNVLITGASRGIGLALSKKFALNGARLHLVSRSFDPNLRENLRSLGAQEVTLYPGDLSHETFCNELIKNIKSVDVLINNAGLLTGGLLENQNPSEFRRLIDVNITSYLHLCHGFLPNMLKANSGLIINNASVSGFQFLPGAAPYAASKSAVVAMTEVLRRELKGTGVQTLLLITPGVQTEMFHSIPTLYGDFLKLDNLGNGITPEKWADEIFKAIEDGRPILWPKGKTYIGTLIGRHCTRLFDYFVGKNFIRKHPISSQ